MINYFIVNHYIFINICSCISDEDWDESDNVYFIEDYLPSIKEYTDSVIEMMESKRIVMTNKDFSFALCIAIILQTVVTLSILFVIWPLHAVLFTFWQNNFSNLKKKQYVGINSNRIK
jgi:hypothetical protein